MNMKKQNLKVAVRYALTAILFTWALVAFMVFVSDIPPTKEAISGTVFFRFWMNKVNAIVHLVLCYAVYAVCNNKGLIVKMKW